MEQALQGNIGRFTLPEILQLLATGQKTGTLGIQHDEDIIMVYFKNGKIIYGYGPRKTYHLGQLLKERGRLTMNQLDDAVKTQERKEPSKRLGQILVDKNYIGQGDLEEVVREQIQELVYSLLSWEDGTFKFYENQYPTQEEITVEISVENVILEGCRRLDEMKRIKEILPDFNDSVRLAPAPSSRQANILLETPEWNILSLIDGRRTVDDIVRMTNVPEALALSKLAALKLAGLVTTGAPSTGKADHLTEMVNRVSQLMEDYLHQKKVSTREEKTTVQAVVPRTESRLKPEDIDLTVNINEEES
jgi:hypothetical protein